MNARMSHVAKRSGSVEPSSLLHLLSDYLVPTYSYSNLYLHAPLPPPPPTAIYYSTWNLPPTPPFCHTPQPPSSGVYQEEWSRGVHQPHRNCWEPQKKNRPVGKFIYISEGPVALNG